MSDWVKVIDDEFKVGIEIATLKKGELQIEYAKDIVAKDKEIERLNKRVKEVEDAYLRTRHQYSELEGKYVIDEYVINELEKWLEENKYFYSGLQNEDREDDLSILSVIDKLKELKRR